MTRDQMVYLLRSGKYREWNDYRARNPEWKPDLSFLDLSSIDFVEPNMRRFFDPLVYYRKEDFDKTVWNLQGSDLRGTKFPESSYKLRISNIEVVVQKGYPPGPTHLN